MEDKCVCCGADVSDLSAQVCHNCVNRTVKLLNQNKMNKSRIEKYYRECWKRLLNRHDRCIFF
jgi:hypothetical protein